ncbi:MAG: hypothetical protein V4819_14890 [Verrucomicrobiota bacterium]
MAFKLPDRPSPRPNPHELADFAELLALVRGRCSATEIQRYLGRIDDNHENIGIEDDDEQNEIISDEMMTEIGYRQHACPDGYPFRTDPTGSVLEHRVDTDSDKILLYRYLLLATRLKMREEKIQAGIDGTQLMEELGAEILRAYLGGGRARSKVFGTARQGGFEEKINDLCRSFREGGRYRNIDTGALNANDDGLDVVGWIPFTDRLPAKVCVFGQCKTGTSWRDQVSKLDPPGFVKRWMSGTIVVDPIKAFFIAESADRAQWNGVCIYGGILFDRCRIVDVSGELDSDLSERIRIWTDAATNRLIEWQWC